MPPKMSLNTPPKMSLYMNNLHALYILGQCILLTRVNLFLPNLVTGSAKEELVGATTLLPEQHATDVEQKDLHLELSTR